MGQYVTDGDSWKMKLLWGMLGDAETHESSPQTRKIKFFRAFFQQVFQFGI